MFGIVSRILILAAGCLTGYALGPTAPREDLVATEATEAPARADRPMGDQRPGLPTGNTSTCSTQTGAGEQARAEDAIPQRSLSALPETRLPQEYRTLVEPGPPGPITLADWYSAFVAEPRDDAWAIPVEAGIDEVIAVSGVQGIHAEYVACRSSRCAVAGYVDSTVGFDSCSIGSWIGRARLIDSDLGLKCKDETIGGLQRFIVFIDSEPSP